jgi:hypothetical protein
MRKLCTAVIAVSMLASSIAWAETLAPGKPAGVRQAQMGSKEILIFGTLGVAAITIVAIAGTGGDPIQPQLVGTATVTTGAP